MIFYVKLFFVVFNFSFVFAKVNFTLPRAVLQRRPSETISIDTGLGLLIGYKKNVEYANKTINAFYSIPYAKPPIGELRFKRSKLIKEFKNRVHYGLNFLDHCPMYKNPKKYHPNDTYNEDCLYMNIFTPNLEPVKKDGICTKNFTTIFYIYGTGNSIFKFSPLKDGNNQSHHFYSPELIVSMHDLIIVMFNYRQEIFASLYLEDEFPGNLALHDQMLAMRWTKKYIGDLCGDANDIVMLGHSFGATFAGLHQMSKKYSKDVKVKKLILQSGTPLFRQSLPSTLNEVMTNSFLAINKLGCLNLSTDASQEYIRSLDSRLKLKLFNFINDEQLFGEKFRNKYKQYEHDDVDQEVVKLVKVLSKLAVDKDCIKNVPMEKLINLDKKFKQESLQLHYSSDFLDEETYLDYKLFNRINIDPETKILIGSVINEEGYIVLNFKDKYYTDSFNAPIIRKEKANEIVKSLICTDDENFLDEVAKFYTNESKWSLDDGYYDSILNFKQDIDYYCPLNFYAHFVSFSARAVSSYIITQRPDRHFKSSFIEYTNEDYSFVSAMHGDELNYFFGLPFRIENHYSDLERDFTLKFNDLWSTFAKEGKMPRLTNNEEWPTSNRHKPDPKYVEINSKYLRERKFEFEERCKFWREMITFSKR